MDGLGFFALLLGLGGVWLIMRGVMRVSREGWDDDTVRLSFCSSLWMAAMLLIARGLLVGGV